MTSTITEAAPTQQPPILTPNDSEPSHSSLRECLDRDGFVLLPSLFTPSQVSTLRTASSTLTSLARSGAWPHIRTLPKQFPPWPSDPSSGIWGVQHLLHPDSPLSPAQKTALAESYFGDAVVNAVTQLLGCGEDELVMELYNQLVRPDKDFELRWHRDDIPPDVGLGEELARLENGGRWLHAQWNAALYDDTSLVVVPGSHKRARTEKERAADPYEADLEGQVVVRLKVGDVMFYDNNILHRGVYDKNVERLTLHGSMGKKGGDNARARNVLQHGIGTWVGKCEFGGLDEKTKARAERMRKALFNMAEASGDVGFSQTDW